MMRLCLGVVAASFVVAVAGASAFSPPEVGRCVKVAGTGKFTGSTCIKEEKGKKVGKGNWEWMPGTLTAGFKSTGGVGSLETLNGTTVTCKSEESHGELSGAQTLDNLVVKFTKCESGGFTCGTAGASAGEIVTNPLDGKLGFENKLKKKLALDLFPSEADGGLYVTFNCGASLHVTVGGSVLVSVPADKMMTTLALDFVATRGKQKIEHFEGEPTDVLITEINGIKPEQSGVTIATTQAMESGEALEANAVF